MSSPRRSEAPDFAPDLEPEVDRLYGLPLADFTRARNELAKRLRQDGRRAEATRIGELAKPSVPAWAVNQLARSDARGVGRLLAAGAALRDAQRAAISRADAGALGTATVEQRDAVQGLLRRARDVLGQAGRPLSDQVLDRVSSTLRAASVDEDARLLLESGRLTGEIEPARFELFPGVTADAAPAPEQPKRTGGAALRREIRERTTALQRLSSGVRRLERDAESARRVADRAAAEAGEREREAEEAKVELAAQEEALADLKAKLGR
jgi:hypothetical protein